MKFPPIRDLKAALCDDNNCGDLQCEDCILSSSSGYELTLTASTEPETITLMIPAMSR